MTNSPLKLKTYHAVFWSFVDAVGARLLQFVIGIVLARLLLPEQFGLIAMLSIFIAIAQSLLDSGFGSALIQKKLITKKDTSSVFFFNIFVSLALAGVIFLLAPWIADFYKQPDLLNISRAMSLVIIINSFSVVHKAMLIRNMDFKIQSKVNLIAWIGSGGVGITLAYSGLGVWSLVAQQVTAALLLSILLWLMNHWRPKLIFSLQALREMYPFGSRIFAAGLMNQLFENLSYVVIGRIYPPQIMGFYFRARTLAEIPASTLSDIVYRVSFPVFSSIQEDNDRLKRALRKAVGMLFFINAPLMIGLSIIAKPLILLLLTEKWLPSVPYLQLLCILGLLLPLHTLNLNMLAAKGRSDLLFRLEVIKKALTLINILVLWRLGIEPFIVSQIAVSLLTYFLNCYYVNKLVGYKALAQALDVGLYLLFALLMGGGIELIGYLTFSNDGLQLFTQIISGFTIYLLLSVIFHPPAYSDCREALIHKLHTFKMKKKASLDNI